MSVTEEMHRRASEAFWDKADGFEDAMRAALEAAEAARPVQTVPDRFSLETQAAIFREANPPDLPVPAAGDEQAKWLEYLASVPSRVPGHVPASPDDFKRAAARIRSDAAALTARDARIAELEAALRPFAELAVRYDPPEGDDYDRTWDESAQPTLGDLRRARAALGEGA